MPNHTSILPGRIIPRSFYCRPTEIVARELLGKCLVRCVGGVIRLGKIVETEAYLGSHDLASHSRFGKTKRTKVLFGPAGHSYIYFIYGIYYCLNIVTAGKESGSAVLIRAIEPVEGIREKTSGPGLLCRALNITINLNKCDVTQKGQLYIANSPEDEKITIVSSARVGIPYAKDWKDRPLRFYIKDNPFVSKTKPPPKKK